MSIKKFNEYNSVNEWFFSKKPIDKAIIEFEIILDSLPNDFDELYTEVINELNAYKKNPHENIIVSKLLDLSNKVLNEISDIFSCRSIKEQLDDFIFKIEKEFNIIEELPDTEETGYSIEPDVIQVQKRNNKKNVKDFHNWTLDITPKDKVEDDDETF